MPAEVPPGVGARGGAPGPRRRGAADDPRSAVLAAARALFAREGYGGTTVRAVAARAGVSPSLVMRRFGSKQQLYREVLDGYGLGGWHDAVRGADPVSRLLSTAAVLFAHDAPADDLRELMITELRAGDDPPPGPVLLSQVERAVRDVLPGVAGPDAELRAALAAALVVGVVQLRRVTPVPVIAGADVPALLRAALPALVALVGPPRGPGRNATGSSAER